jgi:Ras-related protein Rab-21
MSSADKQFKVVLLGEGCVGKTSLCLRYVQNAFNDKHITTIQASFLTKRLNVDNKRVGLAIWDTAGQERFHALGPIYYRDANGALLVYDITDRDSFIKVQTWVKELRKMLGKEVVLAIAGNKCDLERSRVVSIDEAEQYAESVGAKHYSTSAKLNKGLEELFLDLTKRMLVNVPSTGAGPNRDAPTGYQSGGAPQRTASNKIIISAEAEESKKSGGCCG